MMPNLKDCLSSLIPDPKVVLSLPVEKIGLTVLTGLNSMPIENRFTFQEVANTADHYKPEFRDAIKKKILEAMNFLETDGLIVPAEHNGATWKTVSTKGRKVNNREDIDNYNSSRILPKEFIESSLLKEIWPDFLAGNYDSAISQAFRHVEIRLREKLSSKGRNAEELIMEAFARGLIDPGMDEAEKVALYKLFSGANGYLRNSTTHRVMDYKAQEAVEVILLANHLLKIIAASTLKP
jgi:hypothetical protein